METGAMAFAEEDTEVDAQLGFPPVYAKLCRHCFSADLESLPLPFADGAPQRFLPYSPHADDFAHFKDWDNVFPVVAEREKDSSSTRKYAEELWQQLDHLGNAGFDPAKFRVDPYGNVVYWNADPSSPLAWDIDHWFPFPRGGKSVLPNLRIVQWQACLRKRNRLEFLVPWWDLQHGCSINQFLSAFAAKNADFRKRSFALFFAGGEDESVAREHVGECRPWPQQFREKKALCGLAAAAIVNVVKGTSVVPEEDDGDVEARGAKDTDAPRNLGAHPYGPAPRRLWSAEEEEAVKRGVNKYGAGSWKEIKENDVALANRSVAQIKEKFRLMRGASRTVARDPNNNNNHGAPRAGLSGRQTAATTALQKELRVKIMREEERREREEELAQLEETVTRLKRENERERAKAGELEALLKKHKHRVEKQRRWAESQASYRLCLERVLRDTMHQTMCYKEQARVSREACNVLVARLDTHKASCEAVEQELLQRHSQREILEAAASGSSSTFVLKKLATQGRDVVDVSSCVALRRGTACEDDDDEEEEEEEEEKAVMSGNNLFESESESDDDDDDEVYDLRREHQQAAAKKSLIRHAIKVALQVEDTKEAVDFSSPWEMVPNGVAKPPCSVQASEHTTSNKARKGAKQIQRMLKTHQLSESDSETPESECDSDFADDEMSPAIRFSQDDDTDNTLTAKFSQFQPASNLKKFSSRNSKPGDTNHLSMVPYAFDHNSLHDEPPVEASIPSAGESLKSDQSKQEVQKDVIMVQQTESSKDCVKKASFEEGAAGLYKQEYLDELLQQIRFQIPTSEATRVEDREASGKPELDEGYLDELLEQALKNHLDDVRKNDARQHQSTEVVDDEKLKEIGKSNLDKWLQVLLFKPDVESACSSPGRDTPLNQIVSPALSHISIADMRESLERASHQEFLERGGDDAERPHKSLWGALLRKLTVKQQSEHSMLFQPKEDHHITDEAQNLPNLSPRDPADITTATIPLLKSSPKHHLLTTPISSSNGATPISPHNGATSAEGRHNHLRSATTLPGWPGGIQKASSKEAEANRSEPANRVHSPATWRTERRVEDGVQVDFPPPIEKRFFFPNRLSDVDELSETESVTDDSGPKPPSQTLTLPLPVPAADRKEPANLHRNAHKKRVSIKVAGFVGWKKASSKNANKVQDSSKPLSAQLRE